MRKHLRLHTYNNIIKDQLARDSAGQCITRSGTVHHSIGSPNMSYSIATDSIGSPNMSYPTVAG